MNTMYKQFDPFLDILPSLDVHGLTDDTVMTFVNDFIYENYRLGKEKVCVIHGKGAGILRKRIHSDLKRNKYVKDFYLYNMNIGCTIIELKKEV